MAILWLDGFDHYTTATGADAIRTPMVAGNYNAMGTTSYYSAGGRTGGCVYLAGRSNGGPRDCLFKNLGVHQVLTMGIAHWRPDTVSRWRMGFARSSEISNNTGLASTFCGITIGAIDISVYWGGVVVGVLPIEIFSRWDYFEIHVDLDQNYLHVKMNGETICEYYGIAVVYDQMGTYFQATTGTNAYFDDLYITTGEFLGPQRCFTLLPNADDLPQEWVPSAGTVGFSKINKVPAVAADFIQADASGTVSKFGFTTVPLNRGIVNGANVSLRAGLTDPGVGGVKATLDCGGVQVGGEKNITQSQSYFNSIFQLIGKTVEDVGAATVSIEKV